MSDIAWKVTALVGVALAVAFFIVVMVLLNGKADKPDEPDEPDAPGAPSVIGAPNGRALIKASSVSHTYREIGMHRTLVVIYGQPRTLPQLWKQHEAVFVTPNQPCDVVVALDAEPAQVDEVRAALPPDWHVRNSRDFDDLVWVGAVEMSVISAALLDVDVRHYSHAVIARTDVLHRYPVPVGQIMGDNSEAFIRAWPAFLADIESDVQVHPVWHWIRTAGQAHMSGLLDDTKVASYTNMSVDEQMGDMKQHFAALPQPENAWSALSQLRSAVRAFGVMYQSGRTWVRFGPAKHVLGLQSLMERRWGQYMLDTDSPRKLRRHLETFPGAVRGTWCSTENETRSLAVVGGWRMMDLNTRFDSDISFATVQPKFGKTRMTMTKESVRGLVDEEHSNTRSFLVKTIDDKAWLESAAPFAWKNPGRECVAWKSEYDSFVKTLAPA
jgi:hypothetical protein